MTTAEDIKAIFHDSDRHFKAKNSDAGWMMGEVLGQCVGLLSGTEWISLRTRVEVPFLHKNVIEFLPTILTGTRRYFSDLLERQNHEKGDGQKKPITIHAAEDMKFLPFALVASLIYDEALSKDLEKKLYELVPTRERLFRHVIAGGITRFWWSSLLPTEANRLLGQFQRAWIAFNGQAYENAQRMGLDVPIVSLWEQAQSGETDQTQVKHPEIPFPASCSPVHPTASPIPRRSLVRQPRCNNRRLVLASGQHRQQPFYPISPP